MCAGWGESVLSPLLRVLADARGDIDVCLKNFVLVAAACPSTAVL